MMKNLNRKVLWLFMFIASFVLIGLQNNEVYAASKAKYSYKTIDRTQTYYNGKSVAEVRFTKPVLKGKSKVTKKINKTLAKECNQFLKSDSVKRLNEYTKSAGEDGRYGEYYYYATSEVKYNKKKVISICITTCWYAGGVTNNETYGMTFSLKTGKRLYLQDVCKGTSKSIKQKVIKELQKSEDADYLDWDVVNAYKMKKMNFYLEPNNKAVVCFAPYEIGYGGWSRVVTIKSKYK